METLLHFYLNQYQSHCILHIDSHGIKDEKPRIDLVRGQERVVPNSGIIPYTFPWSFVDVPILIHLKKFMLTFDEGHFSR